MEGILIIGVHTMPADWGSEILEIKETVEQAAETLSDISRWLQDKVVASDCWPRKIPESIGKLISKGLEQLAQIREAEQKAADRYFLGPANRFTNGIPLTREDYYLLVAMNVLSGNHRIECPLSAYEIFQMLCYEDPELRCYINPEESPRSSEAHVRFRMGRPPEGLCLGALRPEQKQFFKLYAPEIYARFKRD